MELDSFGPKPFTLSPDFLEAVVPRDYSMADYTYEIIMGEIKSFEEQLDEDHEVLIRLASFGQSILMAVTNIRYSNPTTLIFDGLINGKEASLIQHVSQLNFLLLAEKKADPDAEPRRISIGFALPDEREATQPQPSRE